MSKEYSGFGRNVVATELRFWYNTVSWVGICCLPLFSFGKSLYLRELWCMNEKLRHIAAEIKGHAPFTFFGAFTGILLMLVFREMAVEKSRLHFEFLITVFRFTVEIVSL